MQGQKPNHLVPSRICESLQRPRNWSSCLNFFLFDIFYVCISDYYPELMLIFLEFPTFYECYLKEKVQNIVSVIVPTDKGNIVILQ